MNKDSDTNKTKIIKLILIAATVSFYTGLITNFRQLKLAVAHITDNEYLSQKMYRLAALSLREPLWNWLKQILIVTLAALTIFLLWKMVFAKLFEAGFTLRCRDRKKLKTYSVYLICFIFLIYSELTVNLNWASVHFSILNVVLNIGILLATLLLGWILLKTGWEKYLKIIKLKYIVGLTVFSLILLFVFSPMVFISAKQWKKPTGPNIILVVVDCLRADHLRSYGYSRETSPNMDKLSASGVLYKNAFSCAAWTKPAVASIFASLYPNKHNTISDVGAFPDKILTLAEVLKNSGYTTYYFNGGNPIISGKFNFYQGFDSFFESERWGAILTDQFTAHVSGLPDETFFAYIHYMDLHLPYNKNEYNDSFTGEIENYFLLPHYINRKVIRLATANDRFPDRDKDYMIALYDGQAKYVDSCIKRIISTLKQKKILENTVIIITADHGEEFWDHKNFEHGHNLYNELIHVPLIIAGRGFKPAVIETQVSIVDLFPTILDLANIPLKNFEIDGRSLLKLKNRPLFAMGTLYAAEKYCLLKNGKKLIFNSDNMIFKRSLIGYTTEEKFELFDLKTDPFEKHNLNVERAGKMAKLKKDLAEFIKAAARVQGKKVSLKKEKDIKEELKSLGYL